LNTQTGVGYGFEAWDLNLFATAMAFTVAAVVDSPQGFINVVDQAATFRGVSESHFALHIVGALVGHMIGIVREITRSFFDCGGSMGLTHDVHLLHHLATLFEQQLFASFEVGFSHRYLRPKPSQLQ
jgi:hypothetical protein